MMRWRRTIACGLVHSPLQKELVCIIPPSFTVILCLDCPVYMPAWVHGYPPAYVKYYTQEDTPATGSAAEPQWASPPRQLELAPSGAAEFVSCDHTIETFYQDGKGHLGLDTYRMRNAEAIQKHWCLVFVAYSFLHLDCLPPSPTKGSLPIKTIGEACRQQAQALMQAVILYAHEHLQLGQRAQDIFDYLFAKQQPVLAR
jgi:hypothetical protein